MNNGDKRLRVVFDRGQLKETVEAAKPVEKPTAKVYGAGIGEGIIIVFIMIVFVTFIYLAVK